MSEFPMRHWSGEVEPFKQLLTQESDQEAANERWYYPLWPSISQFLTPSSMGLLNKWERTSCAIVGNSGNLLHTQYGEDIDKHGTVFRINRAQTAGFEQYVGKKTSIRLLNRYHSELYATNGTSPALQRWRDMPYEMRTPLEPDLTILFSRVPKEVLVADLANFTRLYQKERQDVNLAVLSHKLVRDAQTYLDEFRACARMRNGLDREEHVVSPSSGLMLTIWAMQICDSVTVYGVGYPPITEDTPYQYYHGRSSGNSIHDFSAEMQVFHRLADEGLITMCGPRKACFGGPLPFKSKVPHSKAEAGHPDDFQGSRDWSDLVDSHKMAISFEIAA